ncbi:MAG TPA: WS/DGAT domain-containing protein [Aldersonia sp.]
MISPILVEAPAVGPVGDRLRQVERQVSTRKSTTVAPIALLGWLFRPVARVGGHRWYLTRQRRFHTVVSHVRGPAERVEFGGYPIVAAIPVAVGGGSNVTVYFEVLSYADTLAVTAITDPDQFPDPEALFAALRDEFARVAASTPSAGPVPG